MPHARYVCFQLVCTRALQLRECYRVVTSCAATELVFSRNETSRSRMVSVQYVIRSILAAAMFRAIINSMDRSSFCVVSIHYLSSNTHPHKKKNNCSKGKEISKFFFLSKERNEKEGTFLLLLTKNFILRSRYRVVKKMILSDLPFPPLLIYVKGNRSSGEERKKRVLEIRGERDPIRGYTNLGGRGMMRLRTR